MWKELAYPGMFGQSGKEVTEKDLQEVAETFQGEVPVSLGHELADWMPAMGWVKKVIWDPAQKKLFGDVDLNDALKNAETEGLYKKWSIGIRTLVDNGKKYLHHLAYLGAVPPCIRDLRGAVASMINMADAGCETWTFGDDDQKPGRKNPAPTKEKPMPGTKTPEQIAAEAAAAAQAAGAQAGQSPEMKNLSDKVNTLEADNATMQAQLRDGKRTALKAAIAGRIPAAKHADVIVLADSLPMTASIELSDDKGVKSKKSPVDLLIDIFSSISMPVQPGRLNLGDPPAGQGEPVKIDMKKMMQVV